MYCVTGQQYFEVKEILGKTLPWSPFSPWSYLAACSRIACMSPGSCPPPQRSRPTSGSAHTGCCNIGSLIELHRRVHKREYNQPIQHKKFLSDFHRNLFFVVHASVVDREIFLPDPAFEKFRIRFRNSPVWFSILLNLKNCYFCENK